jgi:predicted transcriptional regulator
MPSKATVIRLDPDTHSALVQLSDLLNRPMNKLINEAVRDYLLNTSPAEREVRETLANLHAYREERLPRRMPTPSVPRANSFDACLRAIR